MMLHFFLPIKFACRDILTKPKDQILQMLNKLIEKLKEIKLIILKRALKNVELFL